MKYITKLNKDDFVSKLNGYQKDIAPLTTVFGKHIDDKMIVKVRFDSSMIPFSQSYRVNIKNDNTISLKKMFGFILLTYIFNFTSIILMFFSLIFWYDKNILIVALIFTMILSILFVFDYLLKGIIMSKVFKSDFGCFKKTKKIEIRDIFKREHNKVFNIVLESINDLDLMGLLAMGCPNDEYEVEAFDIARCAILTQKEDILTEDIIRVFKKAFNEDFSFCREKIKLASKKILNQLELLN